MLKHIPETYEIIGKIGSGKSGDVYKAYHKNLRTYVVLKKVKTELRNLVNNRAEVDVLKNLRHSGLPQVYDFLEVDGDVITCPYAHGENMDIKQCLATSCNGAYATLAMELGGKTLGEYMEQAGLLDSLAVCDIHTAKGSFVAQEDGSAFLGWSGVGQDKDLVNPCNMLAFMGGIANDGVAVVPKLGERETITGTSIPAAFPDGKDTYSIYGEETCRQLKEMMRNNVASQYGQAQFGDLAVCAKSGTAEVGGGQEPHAWFAGFIDDPEHPLAFLVLVENGGGGARVAGSIAAQVLAQATAE